MHLRKLVVALAGLGLSGGALALTPLAVNNYLSNPNSCTNWIIGGALTYMEPLGNNFDYANTVTQNVTSVQTGSFKGSIPLGDVSAQSLSGVSQTEQEVNNDFGWGGMGLVDFRYPQTTNDLELNYLHFNDNNDDKTSSGGIGAINYGCIDNTTIQTYNATATYSGINPRGNILTLSSVENLSDPPFSTPNVNFLSNNLGSDPLLFTNVKGEVDSSFDQVNLMFGHTFNDGRLGIRIAGGAQYARIESDETVTASGPVFVQQYANNLPFPPSTPATTTGSIGEENDSDSQFNGIGPRVGVGAAFDLGQGFSLYADSGVELLVGDTNSLATSVATGGVSQTGFSGDVTNSTVSSGATYRTGDETTVVPGGDAEAGIAYTAPIAQNVNITGQLGYMVAGYVHPINHVFANSSQDNWTDFGMQGAYLGLDVSFG